MRDSTAMDAVKAAKKVAFRESVKRRGGAMSSKKDKGRSRKGRRANSWRKEW